MTWGGYSVKADVSIPAVALLPLTLFEPRFEVWLLLVLALAWLPSRSAAAGSVSVDAGLDAALSEGNLVSNPASRGS